MGGEPGQARARCRPHQQQQFLRPAHLGWRMWLITAASACSSRSTLSGSSSWPRFRSSAAVWVAHMSCKQSQVKWPCCH